MTFAVQNEVNFNQILINRTLNCILSKIVSQFKCTPFKTLFVWIWNRYFRHLHFNCFPNKTNSVQLHKPQIIDTEIHHQNTSSAYYSLDHAGKTYISSIIFNSNKQIKKTVIFFSDLNYFELEFLFYLFFEFNTNNN